MIEYIAVILLLTVGIATGGRYMIMAWNGFLSNVDTSVINSQEDELVEGPPGEAPPGVTCDCTEWIMGTAPEDCGLSHSLSGINCTVWELLDYKDCTPQGCHTSTIPPIEIAKCRSDMGCCNESPPEEEPDSGWPPVVPDDCGINASPPCPDGEVRIYYHCDSEEPNSRTTCVPYAGCQFTCSQPNPTIENATPCHEAPYLDLEDNIELPENMFYSPVMDCTVAKCEAHCDDGYMLSPDGSQCLAPGCTLCVSCGGEWPSMQGYFSPDDSHKYHNTTVMRDYECAGSLVPRGWPGINVYQCCRNEAQPTCTFCKSCGGDWIYDQGEFAIDDDFVKNTEVVRDFNCANGFAQRGIPHWMIPDGTVNLCCNTPSSECTLCQSCGGGWPKYQGSFNVDNDKWKNTEVTRGLECAGPLTYYGDSPLGKNIPPHGINNEINYCCKHE